jgi:hypothetical protein
VVAADLALDDLVPRLVHAPQYGSWPLTDQSINWLRSRRHGP